MFQGQSVLSRACLKGGVFEGEGVSVLRAKCVKEGAFQRGRV